MRRLSESESGVRTTDGSSDHSSPEQKFFDRIFSFPLLTRNQEERIALLKENGDTLLISQAARLEKVLTAIPPNDLSRGLTSTKLEIVAGYDEIFSSQADQETDRTPHAALDALIRKCSTYKFKPELPPFLILDDIELSRTLLLLMKDHNILRGKLVTGQNPAPAVLIGIMRTCFQSLKHSLPGAHELKQVFAKEDRLQSQAAVEDDDIGPYVRDLIKKGLILPEENEIPRKILCGANARLAFSLAKKFFAAGRDQHELLQEAIVGLMRAIDAFQTSRKRRVGTYAGDWIRQRLKRKIYADHSLIQIPGYMQDFIAEYAAAERRLHFRSAGEPEINGAPREEDVIREVTRKRLQKDLEREPTEEEIIDQQASMRVRFRNSKQARRKRADLYDKNEKVHLLEQVTEDHQTFSPENVMHDKLAVQKLLQVLRPRYREIIIERFGLSDGVGKTLEEVGAIFKITRERVRQIEKKALKAMFNAEQ